MKSSKNSSLNEKRRYFCFRDFKEFWEDDGEIRLEDERAWFLPWRRARTEIEQVFLAGENEA